MSSVNRQRRRIEGSLLRLYCANLCVKRAFDLSVSWEELFIWDIDGNLLCCREKSLDVQSFKHWNPQDPIQRDYLSNLVFLRSCGAEMWWALVRVNVSVWMLSAVCMCLGLQWAKGPRCGCCASRQVVSWAFGFKPVSSAAIWLVQMWNYFA